jgi:signal transduction histidine kinase/ActR/RegA family two-component response regulator
VAVWATARGRGPFVSGSVEESLFLLQTFIAVTAATFLVLGAAAAERRRADEVVRRTQAETEAASQAKDQFLAALSHELRTPLTPVLALSSALERRSALPDDVRRQIAVIRRNAELEVRLIDDLLDLTRISRGKLHVTLGPADVGEALDHVVEICREEARARGLALERAEDEPGAVVLADAARLRQVLWNLVQNAVKFTPAGGRIVLRTRRAAADAIAIEVSDTGVGIAPSDLTRIFQPFEQAEGGRGGLGLGLAISKALVEAQGGTLTAESSGPGRGATFRIELKAMTRSERPSVALETLSTGAVAGRPRRVLFVEDHPDTAAAAQELLSALSCEVVSAASVRDALAAAEASHFDLVLSDLGLPDGSGLELMRHLRDRYGLAGIALTGYGMEEDIRRSREAGFVDHLVKPITFQKLAEAIERFFAERSPA